MEDDVKQQMRRITVELKEMTMSYQNMWDITCQLGETNRGIEVRNEKEQMITWHHWILAGSDMLCVL